MQHAFRQGLARALVVATLCSAPAAAQTYTPLREIPGNQLVGRLQSALSGIGGGGDVGEIRWDVGWDVGAGRLWFEKDGWKSLDLANGTVEAGDQPPADARESRASRARGERRPPRGRQFASAESPDGAWTAVSEGGNLFLVAKAGARTQVTQDGSDDLKYGQASWVYGEELDQTTAMWWSPDSKLLAFYRFDESQVKDFYILDGWTETNTRIMSEAYPKPGAPNPTARIMIHDLERGTTVEVDALSPASGAVEGGEYYLYNVRWTPDGSELLVSRTPRRQDVLEVLAADPETGRTRVVVTERQDTWQENRPLMRFLKDGRRFLWETERTGFKHFELRSLDGTRLATLTAGEWPVESVVLLDEGDSDGDAEDGDDVGELWFTAWSGRVAVQQQLHVVRLDGTGQVRVTSEDFHHGDFRIAPDGSHVVASAETTSTPRATVVYARPKEGAADAAAGAGRLVATIASGDARNFEVHALRPSELFTCKAADGVTDLYGKIHFPPAFDPGRRYPVVVETYGGPSIRLVTDRFEPGDPQSALGFLMVTVDNRGTPGRGKAFEGATYLGLGVVDADDQAAAVRHLAETRPYVDGTRVGITGHSYGGYMSAIAIIRHPDVFHAAVAGAPVTDWRNYDTIYTERYMRTPAENPAGYDAGSCVRQASKLKGKLLLLHGMRDDNVHPNNTFQLANALQGLNRPFGMMLFPLADHGIGGPAESSVKWSFLVDALAPEVPAWGGRPASAK